MKTAAPVPTTPWYRQPLVWLIIAIPLSAVIMSSITIFLAVISDDGTIADDYYRRGLEINRSLRRDRTAAMYHLNAAVIVKTDEQRVYVHLQAHESFAFPSQIRLRLSHATRQGFDQDLVLHRNGGRSYESNLTELPQGRWYLTLSHGGWRLNGLLNVPAQYEVFLRHDPELKNEQSVKASSVL